RPTQRRLQVIAEIFTSSLLLILHASELFYWGRVMPRNSTTFWRRKKLASVSRGVVMQLPDCQLRQMHMRGAELVLNRYRALEVMTDAVFLGNTDATVQLDRLRANKAHRLPNLHLCQR